MYRDQSRRPGQHGQMLVLFAFALTAVLLVVGLVIDGGYTLVQRRASQNAADFAPLAEARIIAEKIGGDAVDGTDDNVRAAIVATISVNKGAPITFGSPDGPRYVNGSGVPSASWVAAPSRSTPWG
jgi:Putative Flp pilus-assembly TadE/G-like